MNNQTGAPSRTTHKTTRRWANALGMDFHEVRIETNAQLFSDLQVSEIPVGYAPFVMK
jgi:hypothetical protein